VDDETVSPHFRAFAVGSTPRTDHNRRLDLGRRRGRRRRAAAGASRERNASLAVVMGAGFEGSTFLVDVLTSTDAV
jgi:hypothetical protein